MQVYVFGAGASRGSQTLTGPEHALSPLVDQLFAPAYQAFALGRAGLTMEELREVRAAINTGSVEQWLTAEWNRIDQLGTEAGKRARRTLFGKLALYIWRLFIEISKTYDDGNGYRAFVDKAAKSGREFALISFNYDTMLDRAVRSVLGHHLGHLGSYYEANYLKPHGSVNWIMRRREADLQLDPEREGLPLDYDDRLELAAGQYFNGAPFSTWDGLRVVPPGHLDLGRHDRLFRRVDNQYFYPLVLLPLTTKMYGLMPDLPAEMIKRAQALLSRAGDIYLIGYRANDEIFGDMLSAVQPDTALHVVSQKADSAQEIMTRVTSGRPHLVAGTINGGGFAAFVKGM